MDRKKEEGERRPDAAREAPSVEAEDEARRERRQAESPAPGAPRSVEDRAVEGANEWKGEAGEDAERSPPGGTQR